MAATETGDGHQLLATNQVSSVQVTGATIENGNERVVMDPDASSKAVPATSPRLCEPGEADNFVAAGTEMESPQFEHKETAAQLVPCRICPLNSPPSQSCFSEMDTHLSPSGETETEKETSQVKSANEHEINDDTAVTASRSMGSPVASDMNEDANMVMTHETQDADMDTKDNTQDNTSLGCKITFSTADDLDEMMDIGTIDQLEQEAQMKEEDHNDSTENRISPPISMKEDNNKSDVDADVKPTVLQPSTEVDEEGNAKVPLVVKQSSSSSGSEATSATASADKDVSSLPDVKPDVLQPPTEDEQEEDVKVPRDAMRLSSSPSSQAAASTGSDPSSPAVNGMNVVKLAAPPLAKQRLETGDPPSPPLVKVKDEPIDEEYEHALTSSASTASVKDEPAREDLRIGSVYSVTPAAETQTPLSLQASSLHMTCTNCNGALMKGQTAFQRKGSLALFCSTTCLTTTLGTVRGVKLCHNCLKAIFRPQDVILAPDAKGVMKDFCSQTCLTAFTSKKTPKHKPSTAPDKSLKQMSSSQSGCTMCLKYSVSKHEVILGGSVHRLCSDACFNRFRIVNKLSMAGCMNCGSYCHSKPLTLKMEDGSKTLCNMECLKKYKQKIQTSAPCAMCHTSQPVVEMIDNKNNDDSVNLFCSSSCVMAFMVQSVSSSGARVNCDSCGKNCVPAYHLAMSDTSIRNFCCLPCVMAFQEKFKVSQKQVNVFTRFPVGTIQTQATSTLQLQKESAKAAAAAAAASLSCSQCSRNITFQPELIQIKGKLVFVCNADCALEFKKTHNVTNLCEFCKMEKIARDAKRIDSKDCYFCSDGCKLLYRHELAKSWGKHCHLCAYCHGVAKKLVTAQYGDAIEDFCSDECRSKYTMLFCHVAKCDTCSHKGKLRRSLSTLGVVKHFCDLKCLLKFCSDTVTTQGEVVTATGTPVIANVVSLAGPAAAKPTSERTTEPSVTTDHHLNNSGHVSCRTYPDKHAPPPAPPAPPAPPPAPVTPAAPPAPVTPAAPAAPPAPVAPAAPPPKILKNKALLCRPLVQNKGVTCKTQTCEVEAQTDEFLPKVLVLPVPVPVFVPVPMGMYSQLTPKPVGLPIPLPVPMFLPVTMNNAERIVETIKEIKEKIPSDPFEAELILMAEMVAEQSATNGKEDGGEDKGHEEPEGAAPEDRTSTCSVDLDTNDLESFLNSWEEPSSDSGIMSPRRPDAMEKLSPVLDTPAVPSEPLSQVPPPGPPPMDVEADFTVELLEEMALLREQQLRPPTPPPAASRRRQAHRKARDKKGRKSQRSTRVPEPPSPRGTRIRNIPADAPKLKSQYGVDAWKRWIRWRQTQPDLENPRLRSRPVELKEDLLRCTTTELSFGLCCFISEVKRPNGEFYSPDSLFYLCLGIQQYLFDNGRVENIFMDRFYNKFSTEFTSMLRRFKPSVTASGYIHSRVEEEFLWDCKQLGAYSPIVLLNTLLFFCCKYFGFTTVKQHRQLSFAHVMRCTKTNQDNTKTTLLRFYPPITLNKAEPVPDSVPAKRRKEEESTEEILEMMENTENPLRCPVRLYEFYLSKCSESVKQHSNVFYLHPERCCVPNSPLWFSFTPLDDATMEAMLTRILTVRELHLKPRREGEGGGGREDVTSDDPLFIPDEDDEDSE